MVFSSKRLVKLSACLLHQTMFLSTRDVFHITIKHNMQNRVFYPEYVFSISGEGICSALCVCVCWISTENIRKSTHTHTVHITGPILTDHCVVDQKLPTNSTKVLYKAVL